METKLFLWSPDETVDMKSSFSFIGVTTQIESYFNRFGHLPKVGDTVMQDSDSGDTSHVVYVVDIEYRGIEDGFFSIGIGLTTIDPLKKKKTRD